MVVGLKMLTKMRLKELDKAMKKFKVKTPVKSHPVSSASKRKGKEPMNASSKKKRALILEDEDEEDELTISALALKRLSRSVPESMERQEKEKEAEEQEQREAEEIGEKEKEEEEKEVEEEAVKEKSADEAREKGNQDSAKHDHHSSQMEALETGGDDEQGRTTPYPDHSEGVSHSQANPEDIQASQMPEEGHDTSTSHLRDYTEVPSSAFTPSDRANASMQTDNTADFRRILDLPLEIQGQIYALECEIQVMKNAEQASSVTLSDQMQDLAHQIQANAKEVEVTRRREDLKRLEGVVQSMGDFQLVRVPKQT